MTLARSAPARTISAGGDGRSPAEAADAALVAREPELPGLATLLDADAFATALAAAVPSVAVGPARARYLRYKPRTSCLVLYGIELDGESATVYAHALGGAAQKKLAKASARAVAAPPLGASVLVLKELAVAVQVFPADRRLPSLRALTDPQQRPELLEETLPAHPTLWEADLRTLRYKPERRFVGVLDGEGGRSAVVKLHAEREFRHALEAALAFGTDGGAERLPRLLGHSPRRGTMVFEWLEGHSLEALLLDPDGDPRCAALAGRALADLHGRQVTGMAPWSGRDSSQRLQQEVEAIGHVEPRLAGTAAAVAARAAEGIAGAPALRCALHGDFSPDQVLLADDAVAFLDLDEAGLGHPGGDLGSFAARLEVEALRGRLREERAWPAIEAFLEGYRGPFDDGAVTQEAFRSHTAAALLRLALEPFRYRDPAWPSLMTATIERARALAAGG